jgi:glycosyltransferase involved in cell wall biosynthesis
METSVLLLCYNHEKYVEQALKSLFDQKYKDFEIIFLDNASIDGSYEKALALLEQQSTIPFKCIRNEKPASSTVNLNRLLAQANGTYIVPFSSDDWMTPDYIELKIAVLKKDPSLGAVFGSGYWYFEDTGKIEEADASKFKKGWMASNLMLEPESYFWVGFVYTKAAVESVGAWDENMIIEDLDMNVRIALRYPIDYVATPTVYYRRHSAGFSFNYKLMWEGMQRFYHKHKDNKELPTGQWMTDNYRRTGYKAPVNGDVPTLLRFATKRLIQAPNKKNLGLIWLYSKTYLFTLSSFRKFWRQFDKVRGRK